MPDKSCCHDELCRGEHDLASRFFPAHFVDHRVGKEVDCRLRRNTENDEFDFVAEGFKAAVRRSEALADSASQVETKRLGDLGSKDAE